MSSFIVVKNGLTLFLVVFGLFIIRNFDFFFSFFLQNVRPEKKMVDGKQIEDYWASSKKVNHLRD